MQHTTSLAEKGSKPDMLLLEDKYFKSHYTNPEVYLQACRNVKVVMHVDEDNAHSDVHTNVEQTLDYWRGEYDKFDSVLHPMVGLCTTTKVGDHDACVVAYTQPPDLRFMQLEEVELYYRQAAQVFFSIAQNTQFTTTCCVMVPDIHADILKAVFLEQFWYLSIEQVKYIWFADNDTLFYCKELEGARYKVQVSASPSEYSLPVCLTWWEVDQDIQVNLMTPDQQKDLQVMFGKHNSFASHRNLYVARVENQFALYLAKQIEYDVQNVYDNFDNVGTRTLYETLSFGSKGGAQTNVAQEIVDSLRTELTNVVGYNTGALTSICKNQKPYEYNFDKQTLDAFKRSERNPIDTYTSCTNIHKVLAWSLTNESRATPPILYFVARAFGVHVFMCDDKNNCANITQNQVPIETDQRTVVKPTTSKESTIDQQAQVEPPTQVLFKPMTSLVVKTDKRSLMYTLFKPKTRHLRLFTFDTLSSSLHTNTLNASTKKYNSHLVYGNYRSTFKQTNAQSNLLRHMVNETDIPKQLKVVDFAKQAHVFVGAEAIRFFGNILEARHIPHGVHDVERFVRKLVYRRPIVFDGPNNEYMLHDEYEVKKVNGDDSFEDTQLASLLGVSSQTFFVKLDELHNKDYVHEGVLVGQVLPLLPSELNASNPEESLATFYNLNKGYTSLDGTHNTESVLSRHFDYLAKQFFGQVEFYKGMLNKVPVCRVIVRPEWQAETKQRYIASYLNEFKARKSGYLEFLGTDTPFSGRNFKRVMFKPEIEMASRFEEAYKGKLFLVAQYPWNAKAWPGNQYWARPRPDQLELSNSLEARAALCSCIGELQNADVNPYILRNLQVVPQVRDEHEDVTELATFISHGDDTCVTDINRMHRCRGVQLISDQTKVQIVLPMKSYKREVSCMTFLQDKVGQACESIVVGINAGNPACDYVGLDYPDVNRGGRVERQCGFESRTVDASQSLVVVLVDKAATLEEFLKAQPNKATKLELFEKFKVQAFMSVLALNACNIVYGAVSNKHFMVHNNRCKLTGMFHAFPYEFAKSVRDVVRQKNTPRKHFPQVLVDGSLVRFMNYLDMYNFCQTDFVNFKRGRALIKRINNNESPTWTDVFLAMQITTTQDDLPVFVSTYLDELSDLSEAAKPMLVSNMTNLLEGGDNVNLAQLKSGKLKEFMDNLDQSERDKLVDFVLKGVNLQEPISRKVASQDTLRTSPTLSSDIDVKVDQEVTFLGKLDNYYLIETNGKVGTLNPTFKLVKAQVGSGGESKANEVREDGKGGGGGGSKANNEEGQGGGASGAKQGGGGGNKDDDENNKNMQIGGEAESEPEYVDYSNFVECAKFWEKQLADALLGFVIDTTTSERIEKYVRENNMTITLDSTKLSEEVYTILRVLQPLSNPDAISTICKDMNRNRYTKPYPKRQARMYNVLCAFVNVLPSTGYVQTMAFPVAYLLAKCEDRPDMDALSIEYFTFSMITGVIIRNQLFGMWQNMSYPTWVTAFVAHQIDFSKASTEVKHWFLLGVTQVALGLLGSLGTSISDFYPTERWTNNYFTFLAMGHFDWIVGSFVSFVPDVYTTKLDEFQKMTEHEVASIVPKMKSFEWDQMPLSSKHKQYNRTPSSVLFSYTQLANGLILKKKLDQKFESKAHYVVDVKSANSLLFVTQKGLLPNSSEIETLSECNIDLRKPSGVPTGPLVLSPCRPYDLLFDKQPKERVVQLQQLVCQKLLEEYSRGIVYIPLGDCFFERVEDELMLIDITCEVNLENAKDCFHTLRKITEHERFKRFFNKENLQMLLCKEVFQKLVNTKGFEKIRDEATLKECLDQRTFINLLGEESYKTLSKHEIFRKFQNTKSTILHKDYYDNNVTPDTQLQCRNQLALLASDLVFDYLNWQLYCTNPDLFELCRIMPRP
jgi:hypothetical protein